MDCKKCQGSTFTPLAAGRFECAGCGELAIVPERTASVYPDVSTVRERFMTEENLEKGQCPKCGKKITHLGYLRRHFEKCGGKTNGSPPKPKRPGNFTGRRTTQRAAVIQALKTAREERLEVLIKNDADILAFDRALKELGG
jgi:hypothetical protein